MNTGEPLNFQKQCDNKPIDGKLLQDIIQRQSDCSVLAKKSRNGDGAKGTTRMNWVARDATAAHRGGERLSTKLAALTLMAKRNPKLKFTSVTGMLTDERFLKECFWEIKRNKAPGIDGVSVEGYRENLVENLKGLAKRLKEWKYKPQALRRTYISKGKDEKRPLGIPAVEDKIVQMGIKKILEAIYEVDFLDVSYGFRPKKNCHEALRVLDKAIMTEPVNSVVDMDAKKYFDTIDHNWLMRFLKERIADRNLLRLIGRFLNTGVMEYGKYTEVDKGTPQGGLISPILANIYLHYVLDLWLKTIRNKVKLEDWWRIYKMKLVGHYRYYGVSGNRASIDKFSWRTSELAFKWINRRSQKNSLTCAQYQQFLKYHPLPIPKIHHSLYTLSH